MPDEKPDLYLCEHCNKLVEDEPRRHVIAVWSYTYGKWAYMHKLLCFECCPAVPCRACLGT